MVLVGLADLFVTVLYARGDLPSLGSLLGRGVWRAFRGVGGLMGRGGVRFLTFAGPALVALLPIVWATLFVVGFALVVWPTLGSGVRATSGPTPTDFATAFYYSGYTFSTVGFGDLVPKTAFFRVLAALQSLLGFATLTMSISYLVSVYSALVRRNALGLAVYHRTGGTGEAVEALVRLGPGGDFSDARTSLAEIARGVHDVHESHHSYPVVHFFRARRPLYSMTRIAATTAELAALMMTALDEERHGPLARSAGVADTFGAAEHLLRDLSRAFLPRRLQPASHPEQSEEDAAPWREEFRRSLDRLESAGIGVTANRAEAERRYVALRGRWAPYADAFARYMAESRDRRG